MKTCVTAARLFTPTDVIANPVVLIDSGTIQDLGTRSDLEVPAYAQHLDFPDLVVAPGFIDIHVHGGAGHDVMRDDPSGRIAFEKALAKHGVTSYLPTTVTASMERILGAVDRLGNIICAEDVSQAGARPLGIHLEGPFISAAKCGVHPAEYLVSPTVDLFERILDASGGTLRMMTIAPEVPGANEVIRHARERGVFTSIGHSNATFEEAAKGIAAGAVSATHTFNAMRALDHREPGILGAVLSDERIMADIIADGVHVAPAVVQVFLKGTSCQGQVSAPLEQPAHAVVNVVD